MPRPSYPPSAARARHNPDARRNRKPRGKSTGRRHRLHDAPFREQIPGTHRVSFVCVPRRFSIASHLPSRNQMLSAYLRRLLSMKASVAEPPANKRSNTFRVDCDAGVVSFFHAKLSDTHSCNWIPASSAHLLLIPARQPGFTRQLFSGHLINGNA